MIQPKLTQAIKVPERLSTTFFELDCVKSVIKYEGKVYYIISGQAQTRLIAEPGMWLCQTKEGHWEVMSDERYQKYYSNEKSQ
jgi:hypothetical protein